MKILLIGGTGHMGTFLCPMLTEKGHEVYIGTRGNKAAAGKGFEKAQFITVDAKNEDSLKALSSQNFDVVVDFPGTAYNVWNALKDSISHLVACGSLWMYGYPHRIPTPEILNPTELSISEGYRTRFAQIQEMIAESGKCKAVFTAIMPPNICGPGKIPLDFLCDRSAENHKAMQRGEKIYLPDGTEGLISPCDAEDLAALFMLAIENREKAAGEIFNGGSEYAIPMTDFINEYGRIYGSEIPIERVSWSEYTEKINTSMGDWWHYYAHMVPDITKAKTVLGYKPKYTPEETMRRAVEWMKSEGII